MNQLSIIQDLGLKEEEAKIYLACLKLGVAKISEIAKEVIIPRTSIYVHLSSLAKKGFVKRTKKGSFESFAPVEPDEVLKNSKDKIDNFSKIIPELSKLLDFSGKKIELEFFDTTRGLIKMYDKMLKLNSGDHLFLIESKDAVADSVNKTGMKYLIDWQKKFLQKNIITQGIIAEDAIPVIYSFPEKLKKIIQQRPGTFRKINKERFPFSISLYLMQPNHVFLIVPQQNFILNIENKEIYISLSSMFRALFENGEKLEFPNL